MGRQTELVTIPAEHRDQRLDPFALPVSIASPQAGKLPGEAIAATIGRDSVVIEGSNWRRSIPVAAFRGVAVRMDPADTESGLSVVLELNHADPRLTVPLLTVDEPEDIAADWQAWSRCLGLTMLLVERDGSLTRPVPSLGPVAVAPPKPRRMHSYFADRRPRFLVKRKAGWQPRREIVAGDEIIARN